MVSLLLLAPKKKGELYDDGVLPHLYVHQRGDTCFFMRYMYTHR